MRTVTVTAALVATLAGCALQELQPAAEGAPCPTLSKAYTHRTIPWKGPSNDAFWAMPADELDAALERSLLDNRDAVDARLNLIARGLSGLMRDAEVVALVDDYVRANQVELTTEDGRFSRMDEDPFVHLYVLRTLAGEAGIDLVGRMSDHLRRSGASDAEVDQLPRIVDSFPVSDDFPYQVWTTLNVPFLTEARTHEGWDGRSPVLVSRGQLHIEEPEQILAFRWDDAAKAPTRVTLDDPWEVVTTPAWEVQMYYHLPMEQPRRIMPDVAYALRAPANTCDCLTMCVNSTGTECSKDADDNCTGDCSSPMW